MQASGQGGYNIANQPVLVTFPATMQSTATGQIATGSSDAMEVYLYPGGPLIACKYFDASGA